MKLIDFFIKEPQNKTDLSKRLHLINNVEDTYHFDNISDALTNPALYYKAMSKYLTMIKGIKGITIFDDIFDYTPKQKAFIFNEINHEVLTKLLTRQLNVNGLADNHLFKLIDEGEYKLIYDYDFNGFLLFKDDEFNLVFEENIESLVLINLDNNDEITIPYDDSKNFYKIIEFFKFGAISKNSTVIETMPLKKIHSLLKKIPTKELVFKIKDENRNTLTLIREEADSLREKDFLTAKQKALGRIWYRIMDDLLKHINTLKLDDLYFLNIDIPVRGDFRQKTIDTNYFSDETLKILDKILRTNYAWKYAYQNGVSDSDVTKKEISSKFENEKEGYVGRFSGDVITTYLYTANIGDKVLETYKTERTDTNEFW